MYDGRCSMFHALCSVFRVLCSVFFVLCSVFRAPWSVFHVLCSVFHVPCSVFCVLQSLFIFQKIRNKQSCLCKFSIFQSTCWLCLSFFISFQLQISSLQPSQCQASVEKNKTKNILVIWFTWKLSICFSRQFLFCSSNMQHYIYHKILAASSPYVNLQYAFSDFSLPWINQCKHCI